MLLTLFTPQIFSYSWPHDYSYHSQLHFPWLPIGPQLHLNMMFSVIWYYISLWWRFGWHFLWISEQILSKMMDELIHWSKPCFLLSATCGEILSWLIEIWMKVHLVSDSRCNTLNLISPPPNDKEWQMMLGSNLVLVTLYHVCN